MTSDSHPLVRIVNISQDLERRLEERYGATGEGLGQQLESVKERIPDVLRKKIKTIVKIRNNAVHEDVNVAQKFADRVDECHRYILIAFSHSDADLEAFAQAYDTLQGIVDYYSTLLEEEYGAKPQSPLTVKKIKSVEKKLPKWAPGKLYRLVNYFNKATYGDISAAYDNLELVLKLDQTVKKILRNSDKSDGARKKKGADRPKKRVSSSPSGMATQQVPGADRPKKRASSSPSGMATQLVPGADRPKKRAPSSPSGMATQQVPGADRPKKRASSSSRAPHNNYNARRTNNRADVKKTFVPTPNYRKPQYVAPSSSFLSIPTLVALGVFIVVVILGVVWLCRAMAS